MKGHNFLKKGREKIKKKEVLLLKKKEELLKRYKRKRRIVLAVSILMFGALYAFKNVSTSVRSLSAIIFLGAFYLMDHLFELDFKDRHYLFIAFMAVFGLLFSQLYFIYPYYDKIQHLTFPMMLGSLTYHMVSLLKLEKKWKLVFVFFIIIGSIGVFEIGEYTIDQTFNSRLQGVFIGDSEFQSQIDDTMIDLSLGVVGAAVYVSTIALFFRKRKRR